MIYLIDTNCFITPARGYCPIDVAINFWNKIKELANNEIIHSIDKVRDELYKNNDSLKQWMTANIPKTFFKSFDENTIQSFQQVVQWANDSTNYTTKAKNKFLAADKADIYLVAYAATNPSNITVVSMERSNHNGQGEIKLPDACAHFKANCIQLEDMFRQLQETF